MRIKKTEVIDYGLIVAVFLIAAGVIAVSNNIAVHIVLFSAACLMPVLLVKFDIFHPYCWFSAFFYVYGVSYPLLHVMGYSIYGYDKAIFLYELLALFVLLTVVTPRKYRYDKTIITASFSINAGVMNRVVYVLISLLLLLGAAYIARSGFSNKKEIYSSTGIIMAFIFRIPLILTILFPMLVVDSYNKKRRLPVREILVGGFSIAVITAFSGERDLLFRFMLVTGLLLFFLGYIKKKHFLYLIPLCVIALPLSARFKYFFLSGNRSDNLNKGFLYALLTADFNSASQNLQYLVSSTNAKGAAGPLRFFYDIVSLFSSGTKSLTAWYNATYFPDAKAGRGFSMVGAGYVIGGAIGIIALFILIGLIVRWFYKNSNGNMWIFTAYLYFISLMIYSMRGDFSTVLSGIIKQILPVEIVLYLLMCFSRTRNAQ